MTGHCFYCEECSKEINDDFLEWVRGLCTDCMKRKVTEEVEKEKGSGE